MDTPRQRFVARLGSLKKIRAPWDHRYQEVGDYLLPWRLAMAGSNERVKRSASDKILDPTGTYALRTCSAGMSAGICSPARRWKRLSTPNPKDATRAGVKTWLYEVEQILDWVLLKSGFYGVTSGSIFPDLIGFGTAGLLAEEDARTVVRWKPIPVGQYWLAANGDGEVDTIYRDFKLTVGQLVGEFGLESCSTIVRDQYRRGQYDVEHKVLHVVEPNRPDQETGFEGQRAGRWGWEGMAWRSVWLEGACDGLHNAFLRTAGYRDFPAIVPRWGRTQPEDVYGTGPAFEAMPDVKQLQTMVRRKLQMVEKQSAPPLTGPDLLKIPSQIPGSYTAMPASSAADRVSPIYVPDHGAVGQVREDISELRYMIREGLFADLWRIITDDERAQRSTAEEVRAKREERLLQLGPVVNNVEEEYLRKVIDRAYNLAERAGFLPEAPAELDGVELKIEFLSIMSEAQKAQQIPAIERTAAFILSLGQIDAEVLDVADGDKFAERYAEVAGLPPDLLRTPEGREALRQARHQQQQAQAQGAAMATAATGAKDLAGASLENDNALTRLMGSISPIAAAQAGASVAP